MCLVRYLLKICKWIELPCATKNAILVFATHVQTLGHAGMFGSTPCVGNIHFWEYCPI